MKVDTTNTTEIGFGIKECSKCEYYLRCEECAWNKEYITEHIINAQIKILTSLKEKAKYSPDYIDYIVEWSDIKELIDELEAKLK